MLKVKTGYSFASFQELVAALLKKECKVQVLNLSCNNLGAAGAVLAIPLRYLDSDVMIRIVNTSMRYVLARNHDPFIHSLYLIFATESS